MDTPSRWFLAMSGKCDLRGSDPNSGFEMSEPPSIQGVVLHISSRIYFSVCTGRLPIPQARNACSASSKVMVRPSDPVVMQLTHSFFPCSRN